MVVLIICLTVGFYSIRSIRYYFRGIKLDDAGSCAARGTCSATTTSSVGGQAQPVPDLAALLAKSALESKDGFSLTPEQQAFLLNHYLQHQSDKK